MTIPNSSIYTVANAFCSHIRSGIHKLDDTVDVMLGHPRHVSEVIGSHQGIGIFIYMVEPFEFGQSPGPNEVFMVRLRVMITAFGQNVDETDFAGDNALRLLGHAIQIVHTKPILEPIEINVEEMVGDNPVVTNTMEVRPRIIMQPLKAETLNHLWSTQGDVAFQPSVGYELALVPILPPTPVEEPPLVAEVQLGSTPDVEGAVDGETRQSFLLQVQDTTPNTSQYDWTPVICLVDGNQQCLQFLNVDKIEDLNTEVDGEIAPRVNVYLVGELNASVDLGWEIWQEGQAWQVSTAATEAVEHVSLDADQPPENLISLEVPLAGKGQAVLYAVRTATNPLDPNSSKTLRSAPVLINVRNEGP